MDLRLIFNQKRRLKRSGSPEQGQAESKDLKPLEYQIPLKKLQKARENQSNVQAPHGKNQIFSIFF
jgi:hypothetical protein